MPRKRRTSRDIAKLNSILRSNYFRVKDYNKFAGFLKSWGLTLTFGSSEYVGFFAEKGCVPTLYTDEGQGLKLAGAFFNELQPHLLNAYEVAVIYEVEFDNTNLEDGPLTACAYAIRGGYDGKGVVLKKALDDIYGDIESQWKIPCQSDDDS